MEQLLSCTGDSVPLTLQGVAGDWALRYSDGRPISYGVGYGMAESQCVNRNGCYRLYGDASIGATLDSVDVPLNSEFGEGCAPPVCPVGSSLLDVTLVTPTTMEVGWSLQDSTGLDLGLGAGLAMGDDGSSSYYGDFAVVRHLYECLESESQQCYSLALGAMAMEAPIEEVTYGVSLDGVAVREYGPMTVAVEVTDLPCASGRGCGADTVPFEAIFLTSDPSFVVSAAIVDVPGGGSIARSTEVDAGAGPLTWTRSCLLAATCVDYHLSYDFGDDIVEGRFHYRLMHDGDMVRSETVTAHEDLGSSGVKVTHLGGTDCVGTTPPAPCAEGDELFEISFFDVGAVASAGIPAWTATEVTDGSISTVTSETYFDNLRGMPISRVFRNLLCVPYAGTCTTFAVAATVVTDNVTLNGMSALERQRLDPTDGTQYVYLGDSCEVLVNVQPGESKSIAVRFTILFFLGVGLLIFFGVKAINDGAEARYSRL